MDLRQFLCDVAAGDPWASGPVDEEFLASAPVDMILQALRQHRLVGRLARRLMAAPVAVSAELAAAVHQTQTSIERREKQCIAEVARIQRCLASHGHPSVLLKGPTSHLVSDRAIPLRGSSDIDLLVPATSRGDTTIIDSALKELGYQSIPEWPCGIHEAGHFVKGDDAGNYVLGAAGGGLKAESFALDIHHAFPVWGYPDLPPVDLAAPGRIEIDPHGTGREIDRALIGYQWLASEVTSVDTPSGTIAALAPEAAALLSSAHVLKDDLKPHWLSPATLTLGELAEIRDLLRLPQSDPGRFQALASRWAAADSVTFVARACQHYFGSSPSALPVIAADDQPHYLTVWNRDHHPVVLSATEPLNDFDHKIVQRYTMRDYVSKLGEVVVTAGEALPASPALVVGAASTRSFTHRRRGSTLELGVSAAWRPDSLVLKLTIDNRHSQQGECVLLNFGDPALELYRPGLDVPRSVRNRADSGAWVAELVTAGWGTGPHGELALDVAVPWAALPGLDPARGEVSFIAGLQALAPTDPGRNATVFAPVRIVHIG